MSEKIKMPKPVKVAITTAINAIVKMKRPSAEDLVKQEILTAVLKSAGNLSFRFQSLPDEARQAIRESVVADCKAMTYGSMTACAIEYLITPPNLTKWLREDRQGLKVIRGRGRKNGTKNKWNHTEDEEGNPILVPFKPKKIAVRIVEAKKSIKKIGAIKKVGKLASVTTPVKKVGTAVKSVKPTAKVKPHKVKAHPKAK